MICVRTDDAEWQLSHIIFFGNCYWTKLFLLFLKSNYGFIYLVRSRYHSPPFNQQSNYVVFPSLQSNYILDLLSYVEGLMFPSVYVTKALGRVHLISLSKFLDLSRMVDPPPFSALSGLKWVFPRLSGPKKALKSPKKAKKTPEKGPK